VEGGGPQGGDAYGETVLGFVSVCVAVCVWVCPGSGGCRKANWWSTYSPYHYVRITEEEHQDVLVVGGEDHRVGMRPKSYYDAWGRLETWARAHFPQAQEVLTKWTGMVWPP